MPTRLGLFCMIGGEREGSDREEREEWGSEGESCALCRRLYQAFSEGGYRRGSETIGQNGPKVLRESSLFNRGTHTRHHKGRQSKPNSPPPLRSERSSQRLHRLFACAENHPTHRILDHSVSSINFRSHRWVVSARKREGLGDRSLSLKVTFSFHVSLTL